MHHGKGQSPCVEKVCSEHHEHRNLSVFPAARKVSRSAHTKVPQPILLYLENSGSPSQQICAPESQLLTYSLSNGSSGYMPERVAPSSPSFLSSSSLHNIQERGLSPTKYVRMDSTSESSAVRFPNAGENMIRS